MSLTPIPNKAAYLLELSSTVTVRETADVPAEIKSLKRQALHLVDSQLDGLTWKRTITEYWLESDATQFLRDALRERPIEPRQPGSPPPPPPVVRVPVTVATLKSRPFSELSELTAAHMLEVRYAPFEVGLAMPITLVSTLTNADPAIEGTGREPKKCPISAEHLYAATLFPALVDELAEGRSAAGKMKVLVGAGTFTVEHTATVARRDDALVVESVLGGPATSMTRNSITLTLTAKGTIETLPADDALPNRSGGTIVLELHGRRAAPDEPVKEAQLLHQTVEFTLTRIPVGWDEGRLITVAWMD